MICFSQALIDMSFEERSHELFTPGASALRSDLFLIGRAIFTAKDICTRHGQRSFLLDMGSQLSYSPWPGRKSSEHGPGYDCNLPKLNEPIWPLLGNINLTPVIRLNSADTPIKTGNVFIRVITADPSKNNPKRYFVSLRNKCLTCFHVAVNLENQSSPSDPKTMCGSILLRKSNKMKRQMRMEVRSMAILSETPEPFCFSPIRSSRDDAHALLAKDEEPIGKIAELFIPVDSVSFHNNSIRN
ncbi:hypothetical protein Ciccas_003853 [Cichlidogyrus casuarinus]|uniref:Uncharacterized protein n=1 Tax=Cichlidogyrus casuarinus TaxID=1844966 RepID=A0ABD2QDL8_9PLAT